MLIKATSFALVGVVNVAVNYTVFWLGLHLIKAAPALAQGLNWTAESCRCVSSENAEVIAANVVAWCVAVTGSYAMNSMTTFAAESGRKLTWRAYFTFAASGLLGLLADTTTLLMAKTIPPDHAGKVVGDRRRLRRQFLDVAFRGVPEESRASQAIITALIPRKRPRLPPLKGERREGSARMTNLRT